MNSPPIPRDPRTGPADLAFGAPSRSRRPLKILFSEGSSTSARQALYALGELGHRIDLCDPQRDCLGRFSRYVRRWYRCPPFNADPAGYVAFLLERLRREPYDVLFPAHDQAFLLARVRERLLPHVGLAVPEFAAIEQVQSKAEFARLMARLQMPHPRTAIVRGRAELSSTGVFPCYVKLDYGTAGRGVWLVRDRNELRSLVDSLPPEIEEQEILVQEPIGGTWCVAQGVFQDGQLVAVHAYRSRARGVGGSAHARESVSHPDVVEHMRLLGAHLHWHGALHLEYFHDEQSGRSTYIEINPRIGETLNATLSGTNLCDALLRVSLGEPVEPASPSRAGVRTHNVLSSLLAGAEEGANRRGLLRELRRALAGKGVYEGSEDELVRPREDSRSLIPAVAVVLQLLANPAMARRIVSGAVNRYALDSAAIRTIREGVL